jgi:N utilization substance protein A
VALCFELVRATVVVNDDQLSLAIGKRGQNVRLAARLTGWDIDILTPPEFSNGVTRLDQTLKSIEGITQEMVDKVIALGLIDVRDIEEVGAGPLMEELGLDEETATKVVDRCAEEAKVVAVEQEAKKKADAIEKAKVMAAMGGTGGVSAGIGGPLNPTGDPGSRGVDAEAFANPLLPQGNGAATPPTVEEELEGDRGASAGTMPGAMEATEGVAPEIGTHSNNAFADGNELSPEERAIQAPGGEEQMVPDGELDRKDEADEDTDTAALAEGRLDPPASTRDEP